MICPALLAEVEDVLDRPRLRKRVEPGLAQLYMSTVRRIAEVVADPAPIEAATRDADDDYLVALAREHGVDWIVTGDKDLLEWEDQTPPAITPAAFDDLFDRPETDAAGVSRCKWFANGIQHPGAVGSGFDGRWMPLRDAGYE